MTQTMTIHPDVAKEISALITQRSVAHSMIDAVLHAKAHDGNSFRYWVKAHQEASAKLLAMGIDVLTYGELKT